MSGERSAHLALRVGVAFAFLYPPIAALFDPISWAAYFPQFFHALPISITLILHSFGVLEAILALWILSGWNIRPPAIAATVLLVSIVAFNLNQMDVVFRDLSIAAMALALALWPRVASVPTSQPL